MLNRYLAAGFRNDPRALFVAGVVVCIPSFPPCPFGPRDPHGLVMVLAAVQQLGVVVMW